ncbi:MAG: molybdopterin-dependent oxidoreductase [Pigmentiphaga sp.]|uniref:xanthine dehydrogenase family protein molybdopterin-binding subunit n=1 Tax=Pigmentiphaga sp. TaxID=1977564 RepID=UPI0029AFAA83|nr:molybdopterin cofactor-binding domain-containing protein [Pigmentiphaga sp.]MDX3905344.1 molybdopterin-dependent oxidoreductase [Pigmentiphaga sp.]
METNKLSRRAFMAGTGAAAVGVMLGGWGPVQRGLNGLLPEAAAAVPATGFSPVAWVSLLPDNTAVIYSPAAEMGQGTMTAIPMIVAEEMELDWDRVRVEQAPADPKRFGNPGFGGAMVTGSSRTVKGYYEMLRLSGLQAKLVLVQAAAQKWGVPAAEIRAERSTLVHGPSGRRMTYGELAEGAKVPAELPKVDKSMLKPMSSFTIIGKDLPRVEVPGKSEGTATFGLDVRLPGMLWASVLHPPVQDEKPQEVKDGAALAVPGVKKVLRLPSAVAVVADSFATARKARDLLEVKWTEQAKARSYDSEAALKEFVARAERLEEAGAVWHKHGDAAQKLAGAARVFRATYTTDHVAHVTMEPMNCTARAEGDSIEIWVPSQTPSGVIGTVAAGAGYKPENIKVHITLLGGGYGRRAEADYSLDAALIAKAMPGVPIQVIWTREDDFQRARPRPMTAQHLVAGLDEQGRIVGWRHRLVSEGIYARISPEAYRKSGGRDAPVMEGADGVYRIPDQLVEHGLEQRGVDVSFWRAVGAGYTKFSIETLIDEIAAATGKDPLQYRLDLTADAPRAQAVLREAAAMAGWEGQREPGHAYGLAFSDAWNTFIAMVVDVSMREGRPVVHRVWAAVDCGHAISPANIKVQVEGAALFGLSAALGERLVYKAGQVQQHNLDTYPLLRANQAPVVQVKVLPTDNPPGGMGEVGLPPVAPAVANAVARLTGKRIRTLPFPQTV